MHTLTSSQIFHLSVTFTFDKISFLRLVSALEETIRLLEEASNEKDSLIEQLETRVNVLETELEKSSKSVGQKEAVHQEHVKMLTESISRMSNCVKGKDNSLSSLQAKTKELEAELAKAKEQFNESQAAAIHAQDALAEKDDEIVALNEELKKTKDRLQGQMELYKNEIASSLENTTQVMDLMSAEKDSLIKTLQKKIALLEQSLNEAEEEKEEGTNRHGEKEKRLSHRIHKLEQELVLKDMQFEEISKENKLVKKQVGDSQARGRAKDERSRSTGRRSRSRHHHETHSMLHHREGHNRPHHHRHQHQRHHQRAMKTPEGYVYEPREHAYLPKRYYEDTRDDEVMEGYPGMYYTESAEDSIFDFSS